MKEIEDLKKIAVAGVSKSALRAFRKPVLIKHVIDNGWAQDGDDILGKGGRDIADYIFDQVDNLISMTSGV